MIERKLEVYLYPHYNIAKEILLPFQAEGSQNGKKSEEKAPNGDGQDKPPKILDSSCKLLFPLQPHHRGLILEAPQQETFPRSPNITHRSSFSLTGHGFTGAEEPHIIAPSNRLNLRESLRRS